jgi:hypothetical protein
MAVPTRVASLTIVALLLGIGTSARAAGWSRPVTIGYEAAGSTAVSGFVASPNGHWVDLVTLRERTGFELYPWRRRGSFGPPTRVPSSRDAEYLERGDLQFHGQYPGAAINNAGAMILGWMQVPQRARTGDGADECFCAVRAVVRRADGRFGPVSTLAPPSGPDKKLLGVEITPSGRAGGLWEELGAGFQFAGTTRAGRFLSRQLVSRPGYSAVLNTFNGNPQVIFSTPEEPESVNAPTLVYEANAPFARKALVGALAPAKDIADTGTALVTDGHGDDLMISTDWEFGEVKIAYRPSGGSLGAARTIAHTGTPGVGVQCDLSATMNARGEALAAWACDPSNGTSAGPPDFGQAALFGPGGQISDLSQRRLVTDGGAPAVALDGKGRALVVWEARHYDGLISLAGSHGRFGPDETVLRQALGGSTNVGVAITEYGDDLVTWNDQSPDGTERLRVAHTHLTP